MTRQRDDRILVRQGIDRDGHGDRHPSKRSVLPVSGLSQIKGPLSMLGMALGYLGLVAILSMAPFWHLAITPHQNSAIVCTDFGGSR
ncbi:MAG: hypothetical protein ACR2RF_30195 [Geminicoccaceae bacterium]